MMPPTELGELHLDPVEPVPVHFDGWLLEDLPAAAIEAMLGSAGPASDSALMSVELRHLGGALAEGGPGHGALASVDAGFAAVTLGLASDGDLAAVERQSARVRSALAPWRARQNYPNFAEETRCGEHHLAETLERLRQVHAAYDPGDLIRSGRPCRRRSGRMDRRRLVVGTCRPPHALAARSRTSGPAQRRPSRVLDVEAWTRDHARLSPTPPGGPTR
jgi:hypothetical protein